MEHSVRLLLRGILLGVTVSAPIGPIGVWCIRRTVVSGWRAGFAVGLGAATADLVYALVAAFGVSVLADPTLRLQSPLEIAGGVILLVLAWRAVASTKSGGQPEPPGSATWARGYLTGFLLLITNPAAIVIFGTVFAGFGLAQAGGDVVAAVSIVVGVFLGGALWWAALATGARLLRARLHARGVRWVNRTAALVLGLLGIAFVGQGVAAAIRSGNGAVP